MSANVQNSRSDNFSVLFAAMASANPSRIKLTDFA
jgi:hypothetical protein